MFPALAIKKRERESVLKTIFSSVCFPQNVSLGGREGRLKSLDNLEVVGAGEVIFFFFKL